MNRLLVTNARAFTSLLPHSAKDNDLTGIYLNEHVLLQLIANYSVKINLCLFVLL